MISFEDAIERTLELFHPLASETLPLQDACGRVLSKTVRADRDQPPFRSSAMDGYAVRSEDIRDGAVLRVIGESVAGHRFHGDIGRGETVRIFTGSPIPDGADRVVIQEDVVRENATVTIGRNLSPSAFVRPRGSDYPAGAEVQAPCRLGPAAISLLASMNASHVRVTRRPAIAVMTSGDELVAVGETPGEDQIVSSNNIGVKALVESEGGIAWLLPIARDSQDDIRFHFDLARNAGVDAIVTLGGASVGEHDLIAKVGEAAGLELAFHGVALRPGKPLMAGKFRGVPFIGIPGNPVSSIVCSHIFLRPAIRAMLGLEISPLIQKTATLGSDVGRNGPRRHFMCARTSLTTAAKSGTNGGINGTNGDGKTVVTPFPRQDSSLLSVLARSDALLVRPPGDESRPAGASVTYIPL